MLLQVEAKSVVVIVGVDCGVECGCENHCQTV